MKLSLIQRFFFLEYKSITYLNPCLKGDIPFLVISIVFLQELGNGLLVSCKLNLSFINYCDFPSEVSFLKAVENAVE